MKKIGVFVSSCAVICLTSLPAFADPLGNLLGSLFGANQGSAPCGAPAPLLAAGIPAFIALGGAALAVKFFPKLGATKEQLPL